MEKSPSTRKSARRRPDLDTLYTVNTDGSRNFLHPADVSGRWQVRKNIVFAGLILIYLVLPWLQIGGQPVVLIDLPGRVAHLFGRTFTNQDFYLVFFLASGLGFALFVMTSLWGRIWCGYICPQTVFMEGIFRRGERWIEGPRLQRIRRNLGPWTVQKAGRKILKHAFFSLLCLIIAHSFLAYFLPVRELLGLVRANPGEHTTAFFWTMFWTAILYFNYSWFREQTCTIICPYGRLQSALIDNDTIIIGYDEKRGEPRAKGVDQGGDCIDCYRCVEVCPTGIDIRNGLQMECIGCANCVDACDAVMARIQKPRGLVRYDSQRGFQGARRRFLRPRVAVYAVLGLLGLTVFALAAGGRTSFQTKVVRSRGLPFEIQEDKIRNLYNLHIQNKSDATRTFLISPAVEEAATDVEFIIPQPAVRLTGLSDVQLPLFATLARADYSSPFDLHVTVTDSLSQQQQSVQLRFRGP